MRPFWMSKVRYRLHLRDSEPDMVAVHHTTYRVASFFQQVGLVIDIYDLQDKHGVHGTLMNRESMNSVKFWPD